MILQIFHVRKTIRDIKEASANPSGFAASQGKEHIIGAVLLLLLPVVILTAVLAVFSFSSLLGGPYLLAKILFWIVIFPAITSILVIKKLYSVLFAKKSESVKPEGKVAATYDSAGKRLD